MPFRYLGPIFVVFLLILGSIFSPIEHSQINSFFSTRILSADGFVLREIPSQRGHYARWVPLKDIDPSMIVATLAAEDRRFYRHVGIDFSAIIRATFQNIRNRRVMSGASTIPQQIIRIVDDAPRTWFKKVLVALKAVWLSLAMSKNEQLELYLNLVSYGGNSRGVAEASRDYFQLEPHQLSLAQSSFLAVIPRSPRRLNPRDSLSTVKDYQEKLLAGLLARHEIRKEDYEEAMNENITLAPPERRPFLAPHFVEEVLRRRPLQEGGVEIKTTLDLKLQGEIEKIVRHHLERVEKYNIHSAAVVVIDNATGHVRAWLGSPDFKDKGHEGEMDGVLSRRQPGSSLKPFTYALALEKGFTPASILPDIRTHYFLEDGEAYIPRNYNKEYHGPVRLRQAMAGSLNIPAVFVIKDVGPENLYRLLNRMEFGLTAAPWHYGLGITLGNAEVRLLDLTNAYAMLARGGLWKKATIIFDDLAEEFPLVQKPVAVLISDILSDEKTRDEFFGSQNPFHFSFPTAVKTGTSSNWKDNWSLGYTQDVTVGVWVGNFDSQPMQGTTGATGAGPILKDALNQAVKPYRMRTAIADTSVLTQTSVCPLSGKKPGSFCPQRIMEYFLKGTEPREECHYHRPLKIDVRNNLLAGPGCPEKYVREKPGVVFPELFREWAIEKGRGLFEYSPLCGEQSSEEETQQIVILSPQSGSRFLINPAMNRDFQTIPLKALVEGPASKIHWNIDGHSIGEAAYPYTVRYKLSPGRHQVMAEAGKIKSDIISFEVK